MRPVTLSEAATAELDDAYRWYEAQRPGLGEALLAELLNAIDRVSANPLLYPVVEGETHRALLDRFPYGVFYKLQAEQIVIIAFFHARRDPVHWKDRP